MSKLKSLEEIRAWAASKPSDEKVGWPRIPLACPLSNCHNDLAGGIWKFNTPTITHRMFMLCDEFATPDWVLEILQGVDRLTGEITAGEFLSILDGVVTEEE